MRAAVITAPGGPEVLAIREVPRPTPQGEDILVRVHTSALNRADLHQRQGRYPAPPGAPRDIPGIEFAGEVAELGPTARERRVGERVFGIVGGGAHAEFLTVHERAVALVPEGMTWADAGATPEAFITAHDALVTQGGLRPSERVLIHAVASGVGLAAVQLVRAAGAVPYGTSRTADKLGRAREVGLEDGIALGADLAPMADAVARWTDGVGVELVLDLVGGAYTPASMAAAATRGRIMLVGTVAGRRAELDLGQLLSKRLTIRGTVLRARALEEKILATRAFAEQVVPLLGRGAVRPVIDSEWPLDAIADAHRRLAGNETVGKVVVKVT